MGRQPPGLAGPEIGPLLGVPPVVVEDWMERRLLPTTIGADGVRRASQRNVTIIREACALDAGRAWSEADWEALLDRLGPVLRDPASLRPSLIRWVLGRITWPWA